jgi:hypothetical protein
MKKVISMLLGVFTFVCMVILLALVGGLFGNLMGEKVLGNKEPVWEMMYGIILGAVSGIAFGGYLVMWTYRRMKYGLNAKNSE